MKNKQKRIVEPDVVHDVRGPPVMPTELHVNSPSLQTTNFTLKSQKRIRKSHYFNLSIPTTGHLTYLRDCTISEVSEWKDVGRRVRRRRAANGHLKHFKMSRKRWLRPAVWQTVPARCPLGARTVPARCPHGARNGARKRFPV